jgi:hypothetical protein
MMFFLVTFLVHGSALFHYDQLAVRVMRGGEPLQVSAMVDHVYDALEQFGGTCSMEEVVGLCPDLTWNQVYLAIDYLSKAGKVRVTLDPDRTYSVQIYSPAGEVPQFSSEEIHIHSAA